MDQRRAEEVSGFGDTDEVTNSDAPKANGRWVCGEPARYGGTSAARKYSRVPLGLMWRCNRVVQQANEKCWQHRG